MATTLSRSRAMAIKRKTRQHSQLSQHGEFRHVSVSERQRSRPCGQNLRVPFLRTVLPPEVEERSSNGGQRRDKRVHISTTKVSFSTIILILCHCIQSRRCSQNLCRPFGSSQTFINYLDYWGERERAPHRRVQCEFSLFLYIFLYIYIYIYIYIYRTSCRKSLPARILRVLASCVISKLSSLPARALISSNSDANYEQSTSTRPCKDGDYSGAVSG